MPDARFFQRNGPFALSRLAALTGAALQGADPERQMQDIAPLDAAGPEELSFLDNVKYVASFTQSKAGACFVRPKFAPQAPRGMALLLTDDPYTAYARAAQLFYPDAAPVPHIAPSAHIDPSARIGEGARIDAGAFIGARAEIGARCHVAANAVIMEGVTVGEDSRIGPGAVLSHARVGKRTVIHRGAQIGQDGFGFAPSEAGLLKVPQLGRVIIGDEVEIGANACIDRGAGPDTVIGDFAKIDNLVQIAHNCRIGRYAIVVGQVGLAGSTVVEEGAQLGGQAGVAGHITIGKGAKVAAQAGVMRDIPAGETWGGFPAVPIRDWHRQTAALARQVKKKGAQDE